MKIDTLRSTAGRQIEKLEARRDAAKAKAAKLKDLLAKSKRGWKTEGDLRIEMHECLDIAEAAAEDIKFVRAAMTEFEVAYAAGRWDVLTTIEADICDAHNRRMN